MTDPFNRTAPFRVDRFDRIRLCLIFSDLDSIYFVAIVRFIKEEEKVYL